MHVYAYRTELVLLLRMNAHEGIVNLMVGRW